MFELSKEEYENLRCQFGTSSWGGSRYLPMVFTEQGVAQLSSVLNSDRAIQVNIQIIRLFTRMRRLLMTQKELMIKVEKMERNLENQSHEIKLLFDYIKKLMITNKKQLKQTKRQQIGFRKK